MDIALDAMGGDHAPGPIVAGALQAVAANPDLRVVLVGDRAQVEPLLARDGDTEKGRQREQAMSVSPSLPVSASVSSRVELFHCTQAITMEETPVLALRKKPDNSISRCW